jgi:hypothetical protein
MSENGHISPPLVPNQALYQAEPQPELLVRFRICQRGVPCYFAHSAAHGKNYRCSLG